VWYNVISGKLGPGGASIPAHPILYRGENVTQRLDLTNQQFGKLTALFFAWPSARGGGSVWLCACECGKLAFVKSQSLTHGYTKSCSCLRRERLIKWNIDRSTHGAIHTPEYWAYKGAKGRCTNPRNRSYKDYGGRGIEFRFTSFQEFLKAVGYRPSPLHSLDRIENDGHYEPGNVQWATKEHQANNRRAYHETLNRQIAAQATRIAELEAQLVNLTNAAQ
jgi:hypothetical protein